MNFTNVKNAANANELTRAYLDGLLVESRYIDSCVADTALELYGKQFRSPVMIAAFSHLDHSRPNGMIEMAEGAKAAGVCNWAGMGEEEELEHILETGAETIKIIKPYADRRIIYRRLEHAWRAGALAVGMDIDHSFNGCGQPDVVQGLEMKPVTGEELQSFVQATPLPFIVKGVLSVQDAEKCVDAGARGIVISHHHGIMPYAVPPLMVLPKIREAVGDSLDLFVDCGIETGYDAFKALALGAKAVCVGRALLPAFMEHGAAGVTDTLNRMQDELRSMMARTASENLSRISPDVLWNVN